MSDVQIIKAPHTLRKAKIGRGPAKLDKKLLARAEKVVEAMEQDYTSWAQEDLAGIEADIETLRAKPDNPKALRSLYRLALEMKGQGGSFGYRMITEIGDSLTDFLEDRTALGGLDLDVVSAHAKAMRAIFAEGVRDDGGETGRLLLAELHRLKEKAAAGRAAQAKA